MRPVGFAGDDVFEAVAIHIGKLDAVQLAEIDAVAIQTWTVAHDEMLFEALRRLLMPGEPVFMSSEAGDDIIVAVAIHIVGEHLRAAAGCERGLVQRPVALREVLRLLEPAVLHQHVEPAVAIHIAHAQSVAEFLRRDAVGDVVEVPRFQCIRGIDLRIAKVAVTRAHELRWIIADEIHEVRRLIRDPVKDLMLRPW